MLAPSLAAAGKTTHRFALSSSHSAHGRGEPSLGRSADPRRVVEARNRRLGTHGVAVSARPRTAPSQTWRTFLANHLGDLAFTSPVTSSPAPRDDDVVDAWAAFRPAPSLRDEPCASNPWAVVDWSPSRRRTSRGARVDQEHLHDRARTRPSLAEIRRQRWSIANCFMPRGWRLQSSGRLHLILRPMNGLVAIRPAGAGGGRQF